MGTRVTATMTGRGSVRVIALVTVLTGATLLGIASGPSRAHAESGGATTTTAAADYRTALTKRLAKEYRDAALAQEVVTGLPAGTIAQLEAKVPVGVVAASPLLSYTPPRVAAKDVDSLVVFAFGNRVGADGSLESGPVNEALAEVVRRFVARHPVPVYAQTEVAQLLAAAGVRDVTSIDPVTAPDGSVTYLSTAGVAEQVMKKARAVGRELGTVGVIGFSDHAVRCVLTARKAGMTDAAVPKGVKLPTAYDPESNQAWTRSRAVYLPTDLLGRITTL